MSVASSPSSSHTPRVGPRGSRRRAGFTLVELMVTIAVVALLLTVAIPSFVDFLRRNQVSSVANEFLGAINTARATARARNTCVTICKTNDASAANPVCNVASGSDWNTGWLIFTNLACTAALNAPDPATRAGEDYIDIRVGDPAGPTLVSTGNATTQRRIMFDHRGMLAVNSAQTFRISPPGGIPMRTICLAQSGRASLGDALDNCL